MTMPTRIKPRRCEAGVAAVEFALVAPVLMLLLLGLIEVGRYAYYSILVSNAARAGVSYGAANLVMAKDNTGMQQAALNDGGNVAGLTATASHYCQCADGSASSCLETDCTTSHRIAYVQVQTTGRFSSLLHFPLLPNTFNVSSTAVMRVEQ